MGKKFHLIYASDLSGGIGKEGQMAWNIPADMDFFKKLTTGGEQFLTSDKNPKANNIVSKKKKNAVIMGRVTWESIPSRFRPLADRENIIISRTMAGKKDFDCASCKIVKNLDEALEYAKNFREIFVIGGAQLYKSCFEHPDLQYIYHTRVDNNYNCDRFVFLPAHYCRDKELVRGEYTPKGKEKDRVKIMFHTIRYKTKN